MKYGIISVGCNCAKRIPSWYKSIVSQTEKDFLCVVVIDKSSDNTLDILYNLTSKDSRFKIIANENNAGAAHNRYIASKEIDNPEAILMHLDADDAFSVNTAISRVKMEYDKYGCWMTYGSYKTQNGKRGGANKVIPDYVWKNNSHRKNKWSTSALRTCKKWLWDKIDIKSFLMPDGTWIKRATDFACMFPMLEMSGKKHVRYILDIIYTYNFHPNPKVDKDINRIVSYIRSIKPYKTL